MTVFAYAEDDHENPLAGIAAADIGRLPFGAAELDSQGRVVTFNDTEPDDFGPAKPPMNGRDFFADVAPWAGRSRIGEEFHSGVQSGELNAVFDCAVAALHYKVRVHLKISPILGTYWVFVKKLSKS